MGMYLDAYVGSSRLSERPAVDRDAFSDACTAHGTVGLLTVMPSSVDSASRLSDRPATEPNRVCAVEWRKRETPRRRRNVL